MNIRQLKEMARRHLASVNKPIVCETASVCHLRTQTEAILSLPDDDGEELVRLAEAILNRKQYRGMIREDFEPMFFHKADDLARAVLSRYSKREEKMKVSGWVNVYTHCLGGIFRTREEADEKQDVGRVTCIFVSGIEGVGPDHQPAEGK